MLVQIIAVSIEGTSVYPNEALESGSFTYLHGKLQDANKYDICSYMKGTKPTETGVYDCNVHMVDGSIILSKLYLYNHEYVKGTMKGLVISNFEDYEVIQEVAKIQRTVKNELGEYFN